MSNWRGLCTLSNYNRILVDHVTKKPNEDNCGHSYCRLYEEWCVFTEFCLSVLNFSKLMKAFNIKNNTESLARKIKIIWSTFCIGYRNGQSSLPPKNTFWLHKLEDCLREELHVPKSCNLVQQKITYILEPDYLSSPNSSVYSKVIWPLASFLASLRLCFLIQKLRRLAVQVSSLFWVPSEESLLDVAELCRCKC